MKQFYEKRIIKDISGNVYPIWEVYTITKLNTIKTLKTIDDEKQFELEKDNLEFRQLTSRGEK